MSRALVSTVPAGKSRQTTSTSWVEHAACRGRPTSWWFAHEASFECRLALRVCRVCPVRVECLDEARRGEQEQQIVVGVFGGMTASARRAGNASAVS